MAARIQKERDAYMKHRMEMRKLRKEGKLMEYEIK